MWNRRVQGRPETVNSVARLAGFAKKDLIRGEMIIFELDRTGILVSAKMDFGVHSTPLMPKPRE